jgi:hypothetical protein
MQLADAQYEWNPVWITSPDLRSPGDCIVYNRAEHVAACQAGHNPHHGWLMSGGACCFDRQEKTYWEQVALMMVDFHTMVVRDGLDPQVVHREFLKIDEYRQFIAPDCEGAEV